MHKLIAVAIVAGTFSLTAPAQTETKLSLDEIIRKHLEARGGLEKLRAIKTTKMTGKAVMGGGQMEAPMVLQARRPNSMRVELTMQGKSFIQAFDGTTAWNANPFTGSGDPQKADEDESKAMQESADLDGPLVDYKSKGNTVELVGKEDVEGTSTYKLKVTRKSGRVEYHYIDTQTFLPIKGTVKRKVMGNEVEVDVYPGNYKAVEGVMMPFSIEQKMEGRTMMQMLIEKVEVNTPIDEGIFRMPGTK